MVIRSKPTDPLIASAYFWPDPPPWSDSKYDPDFKKYIRGYCAIEDVILLFDINNNGDLGNPISNFRLQVTDEMPSKGIAAFYSFHVPTPSKLACLYAARSKNPKFYSPGPKCRYPAVRQNILWCPVDAFIDMKVPGYDTRTVEDVLARFAAEIWCDGYVPEKVDFSIAERYYMEFSEISSVTAKMCEDAEREDMKAHMPLAGRKRARDHSEMDRATAPGEIVQWMINNTTPSSKGKIHLDSIYSRFAASRPNAVRNDAVVRKDLFSDGGRYLKELCIEFKRAVNVEGVTRAGIRGRTFI